MEVDDDYRDDHDLYKANNQQNDGQTVAEVFFDFAIVLVLDVNSCVEHENQLGTIYRCQDGVPKDTIELLFEPSFAFVSSNRGLVTHSMPALQLEACEEESLKDNDGYLDEDEIKAAPEVNEAICTIITKLHQSIVNFYI